MGSNCNKDKIKCIHSKEAVLMLLSHAPQRLSIKEMSGLTNYHRNTIRPAIKELLAEGRINSMGEGNNTIYFVDSITDHYRRIAKTIYDIEIPTLDENIKRQMIRQMGFDMVSNALKELNIKSEQIQFNHESLIESLIHAQMAYPFTDFQYTECPNGTVVKPNVKFDIHDQELNENDFDLRVYPCLCGGNREYAFACDMVAGALKGAIHGACGVEAQVIPSSSGIDETHGHYCAFNIKSKGFQNNKDSHEVKEEPVLQ